METSTFPPDQPARPTFLKVLCILTFIGVGFLLIFSAMGFNKTFLLSEDEKTNLRDMTVQQVVQMNPSIEEEVIYEILLEGEKYEKPNWIIGLVCSLLSLTGALLMWNLKKIGFHLYSAGEILSYVLILAFFGMDGFNSGMRAASLWGGFASTLASATFVIAIAFDIAFIAMYAMNLKHMK